MVIRSFDFKNGLLQVFVMLGSKSRNLFYVEEILGVKGDGCGRDWNIFIQCTAVADIGPHSKRHRFGLLVGIKGISKND